MLTAGPISTVAPVVYYVIPSGAYYYLNLFNIGNFRVSIIINWIQTLIPIDEKHLIVSELL